MEQGLTSSPPLNVLTKWIYRPYDEAAIHFDSYPFYSSLRDIIEMLITFPEFFLFPVSILAWVFLKFTSIGDNGLKISKIGYASFFFNKKIKISNSRSLLSSTKNQIKNSLFI